MSQFIWHPNEPPPPIEPHSGAKLSVLRRYLRTYFDRLNLNIPRDEFKLDLVDGFCGGGIFAGDGGIESGSPLIMLEEAKEAESRLNQNRHKSLRFDCRYYFVDVNTAHTDHLRKVLRERGYRVDGGDITVLNNAFEEVALSIIGKIKHRQPIAGRSIFLLDQTGYSQIKLNLLGEIFSNLPQAEVILTFAVDALINYIPKDKALITTLSSLGLTDSHIQAIIENEEESKDKAFIQRLLRDGIRAASSAHYDTPFFIRPSGSRRALWFMHLSNHPTARNVMIQCHWDSSNTFEHFGPGGLKMLGWDSLGDKTLPLFSFTEIDKETMIKQLSEEVPKKLFDLTRGGRESIAVSEVYHSLANKTAAQFEDLDRVILNLASANEFDILNKDGKKRSRHLKTLDSTDRVEQSKSPMLPGILSGKTIKK